MVSLRSDHPRLRFIGWEPDAAYPSTTMGTEVTRDGVRQAFVGVIGDSKPLAPVVEFGRVEFEVVGEEPLVLSEEDLSFIIADLEVVGGGLRAFSPIRLEKNEVQPTYRFELAQNVPNPFNPSTTIAYSLASNADVALAIFDVTGARVKTLVSGRENTGVHRVAWDGTNDRGARVSSGVYFYRLIAGSFKSTKKMVLLR
ncbi:MAG: T9SS type A sorting domain-containing protein [Candidatus Krumholzibacteria bacterium]|nr:T9SS type A sorting domain-containing protein [Candidatus Krumholzibacteria bacterium]MDH4336822.1 T9SS type A sorting domain-containing protein [Candidatus Krumholzibacteria bacterium]MDH5271119.1 T9SS type A sorting domain-containing protein [Candidatus Krumholzibacteria bacterium]